MEVSSWCIGSLLGAFLLAGLHAPSAGDLYNVDIYGLAKLWEEQHVSPPNPYTLSHSELVRRLGEMAERYQDLARLERAGSSVEGRDIHLLALGGGSDKILLWSQMHGDEPTATSALLDIVDFMGRNRREPWVQQILDKYTLLILPMLNPDGAERAERRNAQGIDINRDARMLQTPEGRTLKRVRDRYEPFLGFNLHNQNSLTTVGETGKVATIALLAVAADSTPPASGRLPGHGGTEMEKLTLLSKKVTAVLYEALSPLVYGHISRYDETFNPRAFGDNLTLWGTPIVLVESGGNPAAQALNYGVKLNFVGLLAALDSLASGKIERANPAVFDSLRLNSSSPIYDIMLQNAWIFTGTGVPLFRGDVGIRHDMRSGERSRSIIADLGDLGVFSAHRTVDCTGRLLTPGLIAWDPEVVSSLPNLAGRDYLSRGIVTVVQTIRPGRTDAAASALQKSRAEASPVNWSYVVAAESLDDGADGLLQAARWLAAGGRGLILSGAGGGAQLSKAREIARWFGMDAFTPGEGESFRVPDSLEGDPVEILTHWTSEAAARFRLSRRGIVAQGAPADLVIWSTPRDAAPTDLSECSPTLVVIDGQVLDLSRGESGNYGKFIGGAN